MEYTYLMTDCLFCKITKKEIPSFTIYENDDVSAFLDINPNNLGHTLVVPKAHYENIYDTPNKTLASIMSVSKKIAAAIKSGLGAEGVNVVMNNEGAAGQIIPHVHLHVIPRFANDGFKHWKGAPRTEKEINAAGEKIRQALP